MIDRESIFAHVAQGRPLGHAQAMFLCQSLDAFAWRKALQGAEILNAEIKAAHVLKADGICPVDGTTDAYTITVRVERLLEVEIIREKVTDLLARPTYQEAFTVALRAALGAIEVETTCFHQGAGVTTTVVVR